MTKNIKLLLIVIILSVPFWVGINDLQYKIENHIYEKNLAVNPPKVFAKIALTANITNYVDDTAELFGYPKYPELSNYIIKAESAIIVEIDKAGQMKIIFQRNINNQLPIASLTKLITAVVATEFYQETEQIEISKKAISQLERTGYLRPGEILLPDELLHIMLIESSNDAAYAVTDLIGNNGFVGLMNLKTKDIGMNKTYFYNPHGLDPEDIGSPDEDINYSTVWDLIKLAKYLLKEHPQILEISSKKTYNLYLRNGSFHHTLYNTNELLQELNDNVVGSKTGLTERAGGSLFLILKGGAPGSYYINILLNSPSRFFDMRKLISLLPSL